MSEEEFGDFDYEPEEEVHPKFVTTAKKFIRHKELSEEQKEANDLKNGRYFKDANREVHQIEDYDQFVRTTLLNLYGVRKELLEEEKRLKEQNLELSEDLEKGLRMGRENEEQIKNIIDKHDTTTIDALLYEYGIVVSQDRKTWTYTLHETYEQAERVRIENKERKFHDRTFTEEGFEKYEKKYNGNGLSIKDLKDKLAKIKTLKSVTTKDVDNAVKALQRLKMLHDMEPEHDYPISTYVYDIIQEDWKQKLYESLFGGIETFDTTKSQIEEEEYQNEIEIIREFVTSFDIQIDEDTILYILQTFNISKYDENDNERDEFFDEFAYIIGVIINLPNLIKLGHTITLNDFNKCLKEIDFTKFYLSGEIKAELENMIGLQIVEKM